MKFGRLAGITWIKHLALVVLVIQLLTGRRVA